MSAYARVSKFLAEHERMRGLDPDLIHGLNTGTDREAELRVSDLRDLLAQLRNAASMCERPSGTCLDKQSVWDCERPKKARS